MFARVARYQIPEDKMEEGIEAFREAAGKLSELEGTTGGYLLIDRDNCTAITVTFWGNRVAMESSEVRASRLRSAAIAEVEGEVQAVDRCEVALDFSEMQVS
jgi:heme-degrading monooxygenase HmoA